MRNLLCPELVAQESITRAFPLTSGREEYCSVFGRVT
jgi:hypothetical protein